MTPEDQINLDSRLVDAADVGDTRTVQTLLGAGADVHAWDDLALCRAAEHGHTKTVEVLLGAGAYVHARDDLAMRWAANEGHTETVKVLAAQILAPASWQGRSRTEIMVEADALYNKITAENIQPEYVRRAGTILLDYALTCWEQVRPAPPKLNISALPAKPRPV